MLQLPTQLQQRCIGFLHDERATLKSLRLTQKSLSILATNILFRSVTLCSNEESISKINALANSQHAQLARTLVIDASRHPEDDSYKSTREDGVPDIIKPAFQYRPEFRNISHFILKFATDCADSQQAQNEELGFELDDDVVQHPRMRLEILRLFLKSLEDANNIETLSIDNLQDSAYRGNPFDTDSFVVVRNRLCEVHLRVTSEKNEYAPTRNIRMPALHRGFTHDLPNFWLKPMINQLTRLSLHSSGSYWGIWPFVDFREIPPFTQLKSLCFANLTFVHEWQVHWILAHGSTLKELIFDDCPIVVALNMSEKEAKVIFPGLSQLKDISPDMTDEEDVWFTTVDLRWHDVLDKFRARLTQLTHFAMGNSGRFMNGVFYSSDADFDERYDLKNCLARYRYTTYDNDTGPSPWDAFEECGDEAPEDEVIDGEEGDVEYGAHEFWLPGWKGEEECHVVEFPRCKCKDEEALEALMETVRHRVHARV